MTTYVTEGNVREQLGAEQAAEITPEGVAATATVANNIDAIIKVAASIGNVPNLDTLVAAVNAALVAAQTAASQASTSANAAQAAATGIDTSVQAADDWARKLGGPVEGTDVSAKQAALDAGADAASISGVADQVNILATAVSDNANLVSRYINDPPGTEVETGKFSLPTYEQQIQDIINQAPVLAGRYISTAGPSGSEDIPFVADDFFHTVEINRAVGHDANLQCIQGLYTGPPPQGTDRSYAWIQVINGGKGNITIEGPLGSGGTVTTVYPPKLIADTDADYKVVSPGTSSATAGKLPVIPVPAGTDRHVTIVVLSSYWSGTGHTETITSSKISSLTKVKTAGDGTVGNANPILMDVWTGVTDLGGGFGSSIADLDVNYSFSGFFARGEIHVFVHQDCSGFENIDAKARAGNTTTATISATPSIAQSVNIVVSGFKGASAAPVNVTVLPVTTNINDKTDNGVTQPGSTSNDISFGSFVDAGLSAVAYNYTATAAVGAPAVTGIATLKPRTVTTVGSDDGLIIDAGLTKPFTIGPGQQGFVQCASDGISWYADK